MARLGSRAKAGFYPTPERVCGQLKQVLDIEQDARLLDPCCGMGKTLDSWRKIPPVESIGIELDHQRATEARSRLSRYYGAIRWSRSALHRPPSVCSI